MGVETEGLVAGVNGNTDRSINRYGRHKRADVSCWYIEEFGEFSTTCAFIDHAQAILVGVGVRGVYIGVGVGVCVL